MWPVAGCGDELQCCSTNCSTMRLEGFVLLAVLIASRMSFCVSVMEAPARLNLPKLFLSLSSLFGRWALMRKKAPEDILAGSSECHMVCLQFQMCGRASHLEVSWHHNARQPKTTKEQLLFGELYCYPSIEGLSTDS